MAATQSQNILIVEDDADFRHTLAQQLRLHEEFEVEEVGTGEAAIADAEKTNFDAILLDVGLPDMDGRDVCRVLRRKGIHAPVIMLTALDGDADTVLGLYSGANDYVTKPFRLGVLLARLRAHIRQHEMSEDTSFSVGPYIFRPAIKVLQRSDGKKDVNLSENLLRVPQRGGRGSECDDVPARRTSRQLSARITNGKGPVVRPALFYIAPAFFRLSSSALSRG